MYKIKTFIQGKNLYETGLEKQFNLWSKVNPEVVVLDLQYQVDNGTQYLCVGYDDCGFMNDFTNGETSVEE